MTSREYTRGSAYPEYEPMPTTRRDTPHTRAYGPQSDRPHPSTSETPRGPQRAAQRAPERKAPMTLERFLTIGRDVLTREPAEIPPPRERARLRKAAGLSATTAAVLCGATRQAIERWEAGTWEPRRHVDAYGRFLAFCKTAGRA